MEDGGVELEGASLRKTLWGTREIVLFDEAKAAIEVRTN